MKHQLEFPPSHAYLQLACKKIKIVEGGKKFRLSHFKVSIREESDELPIFAHKSKKITITITRAIVGHSIVSGWRQSICCHFAIHPPIAKPVWRNGRAQDSEPRGPGFETRLGHLVFLLGKESVWPSSQGMFIGPSPHHCSPIKRAPVHSTVKRVTRSLH